MVTHVVVRMAEKSVFYITKRLAFLMKNTCFVIYRKFVIFASQKIAVFSDMKNEFWLYVTNALLAARYEFEFVI